MSNLVKHAPTKNLALEKIVPTLVAGTISQEDWDAMPQDERSAIANMRITGILPCSSGK